MNPPHFFPRARLPVTAQRLARVSGLLPVLAAVGYSTLARASSVVEELTVGTSTSAAGIPARSFVGNRLGGSYDTKDFSLSLNTYVTHYTANSDLNASNVLQISLAGSYFPSDHWSLGAYGSASPSSVTTEHVSQVGGGRRPIQKVSGSSLGIALDAAYDTAGDSVAETVVDASVGATRFDATQQLGRLTTSSAEVTQFRMALGVTETIAWDTDVGVLGSYYRYSTDPPPLGASQLTGAARGSLGDGLTVAPYRWSIRPSVLHRFGSLSTSAFFVYGQYVSGGADSANSTMIGGVKVQYKFSMLVRAWLAGTYQSDLADTGQLPKWVTASVGLRLVF